MNTVIQNLYTWGCDIDGAMRRFLDDEDLYMTCLDTVLADENFENLGKALKENNVKTAFDTSHTLKGVLANMGLTPLLDEVVKIVEPLRFDTCDCASLLPVYDLLMEKKEKLKELTGR